VTAEAQSDNLIPLDCDPDRLWSLHAFSPQAHASHVHQQAAPGNRPKGEVAVPASQELLGGSRLEDVVSQRRNAGQTLCMLFCPLLCHL